MWINRHHCGIRCKSKECSLFCLPIAKYTHTDTHTTFTNRRKEYVNLINLHSATTQQVHTKGHERVRFYWSKVSRSPARRVTFFCTLRLLLLLLFGCLAAVLRIAATQTAELFSLLHTRNQLHQGFLIPGLWGCTAIALIIPTCGLSERLLRRWRGSAKPKPTSSVES